MALNPLVQAFLDQTSGANTPAFPGGRYVNRGLTALGERYNPNPNKPKEPDPLVANPNTRLYVNPGSGVGSQLGLSSVSGPEELRKYVQQVAAKYGWNTPEQLNAWYNLIQHESGWNPNAQNPTSTAYGLGQFLDSTWAGVGAQKTSDPLGQIEAMAKYIQNRYNNPYGAWGFWQNPTSGPSHWY